MNDELSICTSSNKDIQLKVWWHKRGFLLPLQLPHTLIVCTVGIGLDGRKPEAQLLQQKLGLASVMRTPEQSAPPRHVLQVFMPASINYYFLHQCLIRTYTYSINLWLLNHNKTNPQSFYKRILRGAPHRLSGGYSKTISHFCLQTSALPYPIQ